MSVKSGFVNIYPYRPHSHQAKYLEMMAKSLGWETHAFVCDANVRHCYLREIKGAGRSECAKCMIGGLRSFNFDSVTGSGMYWSEPVGLELNLDDFEFLVESSAYTLTRVESYAQRTSDIVSDKKRKLLPGAYGFYQAALRWIQDKQLDVVFAFNGRMDLTRAVIEACKTAGVPFITHERPLFGHGLILNKNSNCSSLTNIHAINREFGGKYLTEQQARIAAKLAAQRLTGGNPLEWKRYNTSPEKTLAWPGRTSNIKVLVCPSSKNELLGHPDWDTEWLDNTDALDLAVAKGWFKYEDILVRFHPSWSVDFGKVSARLCEQHYTDWCKSRGVSFVGSSSKVSTQDLIRLADVVVLNGSNTVFEAGILGKPVICLGPSPYSYSGAAVDVLNISDFERLKLDDVIGGSPEERIRKTLRYYYSKAAREPCFVDYVRSKTVTECRFYEGADPAVLEQVLYSDGWHADDSRFNNNSSAEDEFVQALLHADAESLIHVSEHEWRSSGSIELDVLRRPAYRLIDFVRGLTQKGV